MSQEYFEGIVDTFPDGWYFVNVPEKNSDKYKDLVKRGNVAIVAQIGDSKWDTLLWGYGDGKFFITLPAKVRKKESIDKGSQISVLFEPR